jgi:hypothetical protein
MVNREIAYGNNDKIQVHKNGRLVLRYPDRSRVIAQENSKILLSSSEVSSHGNANKLLTIFNGTLYLNAHKPFLNYEGHYLRIFTPTMGLVTKTGAFLIDVDKKTLGSRVFVLSGILEVRGIKNLRPFYLNEGMHISSDSNGTFSKIEEINNDDFMAEFNWLDQKMLEGEFLRGKLIRKRDQDIIAGKSLGRVVVSDFSILVKTPRNWNVADFLTGFAAEQISETSFRETIRAGSSSEPPIEMGRYREADRVVTGKVKDFAIDKKAVLNEDSTKYQLEWEVRISLEITVINTITGEEVKTEILKEEHTAKGTKNTEMETVLKQPLDFRNEIIQKSLLGKALRELKEKLRKFSRASL